MTKITSTPGKTGRLPPDTSVTRNEQGQNLTKLYQELGKRVLSTLGDGVREGTINVSNLNLMYERIPEALASRPRSSVSFRDAADRVHNGAKDDTEKHKAHAYSATKPASVTDEAAPMIDHTELLLFQADSSGVSKSEREASKSRVAVESSPHSSKPASGKFDHRGHDAPNSASDFYPRDEDERLAFIAGLKAARDLPFNSADIKHTTALRHPHDASRPVTHIDRPGRNAYTKPVPSSIHAGPDPQQNSTMPRTLGPVAIESIYDFSRTHDDDGLLFYALDGGVMDLPDTTASVFTSSGNARPVDSFARIPTPPLFSATPSVPPLNPLE
jgi:hypothetical protein